MNKCEHEYKSKPVWIPYCLKCKKSRDDNLRAEGFATAFEEFKKIMVRNEFINAWIVTKSDFERIEKLSQAKEKEGD